MRESQQFTEHMPFQAAPQLTPAGPSGVVQLLDWELSINAHELLVAVPLLLGCWNIRAVGSCRALRFWGVPQGPPPSAPLQTEQGPCTAHYAA